MNEDENYDYNDDSYYVCEEFESNFSTNQLYDFYSPRSEV